MDQTLSFRPKHPEASSSGPSQPQNAALQPPFTAQNAPPANISDASLSRKSKRQRSKHSNALKPTNQNKRFFLSMAMKYVDLAQRNGKITTQIASQMQELANHHWKPDKRTSLPSISREAEVWFEGMKRDLEGQFRGGHKAKNVAWAELKVEMEQKWLGEGMEGLDLGGEDEEMGDESEGEESESESKDDEGGVRVC